MSLPVTGKEREATLESSVVPELDGGLKERKKERNIERKEETDKQK
jgi:hypothetical protein